MTIWAWVVLFGGFLLMNEVLELPLRSPVRALLGVVIIGAAAALAWGGYKTKVAQKQDARHAMYQIIMIGFGSVLFLISLFGGFGG